MKRLAPLLFGLLLFVSMAPAQEADIHEALDGLAERVAAAELAIDFMAGIAPLPRVPSHAPECTVYVEQACDCNDPGCERYCANWQPSVHGGCYCVFWWTC